MKKWKIIVLIFVILLAGFILYTNNPEYNDLKRFVNPIYNGEPGYQVVDSQNRDVTETFIEDTKFYHTFQLYGKIKAYIQEHELTLTKNHED